MLTIHVGMLYVYMVYKCPRFAPTVCVLSKLDYCFNVIPSTAVKMTIYVGGIIQMFDCHNQF